MLMLHVPNDGQRKLIQNSSFYSDLTIDRNNNLQDFEYLQQHMLYLRT